MANRSCRDRSALDSVSGRLADVFMAGPPVVQKSQHRRYELRPRSVRNLLCGRRTPDKPNWEGHLPRACRERSPLQASPLLHHISNHKSNTSTYACFLTIGRACVGQECVSTCRSRGSRYHKKKKKT